MSRHPEMSEGISSRLSAVQNDWQKLLELSKQRKAALQAAHKQHKLEENLEELRDWVKTTVKRMKDMELPSTVAEAEAAIQVLI